MNFPERRHLERMTPERLVYVDLKPDNGGIVLNVSDGGLCFQSVAPVRKHQSFAFSFREHSVATDCVGEVVWTDQSCKFGGMRFTRVSAETRSEIEGIAKSSMPHTEESPAALRPVASDADGAALTGELSTLAVKHASSLQIALLREAHVLPEARIAPARAGSRQWPRMLLAVLVVYALWATVQLYRLSRPGVSQPQAMLQQSTAELTPLVPSMSTETKPRAGVAVQHSKTASRRIVPSAAEPARPLLKAAPFRFEYPTIASGTPSGRVDLKLLISTTGTVQDVKVVAGRAALVDASARAARNWRYRPLELDGQPVEAEAHVRLSFAGPDAVSINFRP